MMISEILMMISAGIIALLGSAHLLLTFRGPKLWPNDRALKASMQATHLVITTETTMWRAWLGFNASHSMGAILFACVYGYLSMAHSEILFQSWPLQLLGLIMLSAYLILAKAYWFITPLAGISIALVSYILSIALAWT